MTKTLVQPSEISEAHHFVDDAYRKIRANERLHNVTNVPHSAYVEFANARVRACEQVLDFRHYDYMDYYTMLCMLRDCIQALYEYDGALMRLINLYHLTAQGESEGD